MSIKKKVLTNEKPTNLKILKIRSKEQKVTSGIDLEYVYSENTKAIKVIYVLIQITHMLLQIIEHSDICGDFKEKYRSVKVFRRKFYAHLIERIINIEQIQIKIQIKFQRNDRKFWGFFLAKV